MQVEWQQLAAWQSGLISRRQLRAAGMDRWKVRNQVSSGRWMTVGPRVVATFTGDLAWEQRAWAGLLHAGPAAVLGGLACARQHGLRGWERPLIDVVVPATTTVPHLDGVRFTRTRRDLDQLRAHGVRAHLMQLEPAVLLRAASGMPERTSGGLLASVVQQRLTSADKLLSWLPLLRPLPRTVLMRSVLRDIRGGADSMAEIDLGRVCRRSGILPPARQRRRKDRGGRWRWTDAEWDLPDGRTLVLEVDGAFHLEVMQWTADVKRQRKISTPDRTVVRATALELRIEPEEVVQDLRALGVPTRSGARSAGRAPESAP